MVDMGLTAQAINAKKMQLFIGTGDDDEWLLLQNARVLISHPIFREPTTSGGVATYTGAPDNTISGTMLFTRDEWNDSNNGFINIIAPATDSGEVESNYWNIKFVDVSGDSAVVRLTFSSCKLSVVDISKSVEGAVKADITVICPGEPVTTTV